MTEGVTCSAALDFTLRAPGCHRPGRAAATRASDVRLDNVIIAPTRQPSGSTHTRQDAEQNGGDFRSRKLSQASAICAGELRCISREPLILEGGDLVTLSKPPRDRRFRLRFSIQSRWKLKTARVPILGPFTSHDPGNPAPHGSIAVLRRAGQSRTNFARASTITIGTGNRHSTATPRQQPSGHPPAHRARYRRVPAGQASRRRGRSEGALVRRARPSERRKPA